MRLFFLVMLTAWSPAVLSTMQIADVLLLEGKELKLHTQPIRPLLARDPKLEGRLMKGISGVCSASWIGLRGTWTISDGQLFLVRLVSDPCSSSPTNIPLSRISGKRNAPVVASWFSGELIVPQGEFHVVIIVQEGKVLRQERRDTKHVSYFR